VNLHQIKDGIRGRQGTVLDLAKNESPVEPSPMMTRAIFKYAFEVNRYPDDGAQQLRAVVAQKHCVRPGQVFVGNGTGEIFDIAARIALAETGEVVTSFPAAPVYEALSQRHGGTIGRVPLHNWRVDLQGMAEKVSRKTRLVVLGNPHDPVGTTVRGIDLARFFQELPDEVMVVVDEAYVEYVTEGDFCSALEFLNAHSGLLVMRSLSNAYGLAGLRIGYAIATAGLVERLDRERYFFNTNMLAQAAAVAALEDEVHLEKTLWINRSARQVLCERLDGMGLGYIPSQANFILVRVFDGEEVTATLLEAGVRVMPMQALGLPDYVRITTGTVEDMHRVADHLEAICTGDAMRLANRLCTTASALDDLKR